MRFMPPIVAAVDTVSATGVKAGLLAAVATLLWLPSPLAAQSMGELLEAVRSGGGWVAVPVEDGRGAIETATVPVGGLPFRGCTRLWTGHSGSWRIRAEDLVAERTMEVTMNPGEAVRFRHQPLSRAKLRVEVDWSEPRDTTLFLWVGLGDGSAGKEDPCEPRQRGGGDARGEAPAASASRPDGRPAPAIRVRRRRSPLP